jgi:hypothetical protein
MQVWHSVQAGSDAHPGYLLTARVGRPLPPPLESLMALPVPPDPPAAGVTDTLSWQQWDISLRYQEYLRYQAWITGDMTPPTDADLTATFTAALLSNWDWMTQSKAAPANVVATAKAMVAEYRKSFPAPV